MNYKNLIKIALKALANNKFRGFLTMLGIIIGVASVIAMLAIGQGSKRSIREQISEMGSNMIMVHPGNGRFGGVRQSASSMQTLKLEDYRTIEREASYISACSPTVSSSGQAIYGANNAPTTLYGVNGDYMTIRKYSVGEGEMFTDHDVKTAAKVCVELSSMLSSTTDLMTVLLACIAGISLLVGGIGIMNIMYVSVTERTREIGLRMSIGAKGRHILWQFLIEAVIISVTGGVIGVVLGITASAVIKYWIGWPVYVQLYSVVLSFAVCTVTGIFFGWYPARKASNLDPIEAIRYE